MWMLLINPIESATGDWEARVVENEEFGNQMVDRLGLEQQFFLLPISSVAGILRGMN